MNFAAQAIKGFVARHPQIVAAARALILLIIAAIVGDVFGADAILSLAP